jgi:hypothetical protein
MPTDLTVILEHRPGELARLGETAGQAGVTVHGLAAFTGEGMRIADEREVIVIDVEDRPAALGR